MRNRATDRATETETETEGEGAGTLIYLRGTGVACISVTKKTRSTEFHVLYMFTVISEVSYEECKGCSSAELQSSSPSQESFREATVPDPSMNPGTGCPTEKYKGSARQYCSQMAKSFLATGGFIVTQAPVEHDGLLSLGVL